MSENTSAVMRKIAANALAKLQAGKSITKDERTALEAIEREQQAAKAQQKSLQKRPGRPSDAIIKGRIADMIDFLATHMGVQRCRIHDEFVDKWGVHWTAVDRIVHRAREEMMLRLKRSKEEFKVDVLLGYEATINDPNSTNAEKNQARKGIRELFGLDAPIRTEVSGPQGGKIELEHKIAQPIDYAELERVAGQMFGISDRNGHTEQIHSAEAGTETGIVPERNGH